MLIRQSLKLFVEKILVLGVGLNLPGEGGILLSELLLFRFLVDERLMDDDEFMLVDLLISPEVHFMLVEPPDL